MTLGGMLFLGLAIGAGLAFSGAMVWGIHVTKPKH